jgi:hypothetical protein
MLKLSAEKSYNFFKKRCLQVFTGSGRPRVDPSESCTDDGHTGLFTRGVLRNFYFAATNNTMAVTTKSNVLFLLN